MKDKKNVMYAKDVVSFARSKGWFQGKDADFSWKMAYAKPDFSGRRFCDARVWAPLKHTNIDFGLPFMHCTQSYLFTCW